MSSKQYLWLVMNNTLLECPGCRSAGSLQVLPWQSGPGVFGAVSLFCDGGCEGFFILKLDSAKELKFTEIEELPTLPEE